MRRAFRVVAVSFKVLFLVTIFSVLLNLNYSDTIPMAVAVDDEVTIPEIPDSPSKDNILEPDENLVVNPVNHGPNDGPINPEGFYPDISPQPSTARSEFEDDIEDIEETATPPESSTPDETSEHKDESTPIEYDPGYDQVEFNNIVLGGREKTAYLTFDDGPTPRITRQVLDILKEEDIKATFFVIGSSAEDHPYLVRQVYDEGHGIGNHTYSHNFSHIYSAEEKYIKELIKTENILKSILGEDKQFKVTRFPGGSFGEKLAPFRSLVNESGYVYIDWNCVNGDAETVETKTKEELIERLKSTVKGQTNLVVLMHDAYRKDTTVEALPQIIKYLKSLGYKFELLPWTR